MTGMTQREAQYILIACAAGEEWHEKHGHHAPGAEPCADCDYGQPDGGGCWCVVCICPHAVGGLDDSDGRCCGQCHAGPCRWQKYDAEPDVHFCVDFAGRDAPACDRSRPGGATLTLTSAVEDVTCARCYDRALEITPTHYDGRGHSDGVPACNPDGPSRQFRGRLTGDSRRVNCPACKSLAAAAEAAEIADLRARQRYEPPAARGYRAF